MHATIPLLIEIDRPEAKEPLRFMCGPGFEFLREDKTGREIYGLMHGGKEFLFFPFTLNTPETGVVNLSFPSEYEDTCLDAGLDGARIVFHCLDREAFFGDPAKDGLCLAGILRVSSENGFSVLLDQPGAMLFGAKDACREHKEPHKKDEIKECACAQGGQDARLAASIREAEETLNQALKRAFAAGLTVEITLTRDAGAPADGQSGPLVAVKTIARVL